MWFSCCEYFITIKLCYSRAYLLIPQAPLRAGSMGFHQCTPRMLSTQFADNRYGKKVEKLINVDQTNTF